MDKKLLKKFAVGFLIYFSIFFLFGFYGEKKTAVESLKIAAIQSVLLNTVITLIALVSPQKFFKKNKK